MRKWRGILIAFEGIDGSGLTTHSKLLYEYLLSIGYQKVYLTKEPTNSPIGNLIRSILQHKFHDLPARPDLMALLFASDRIYHLFYEPIKWSNKVIKGILNALREGFIVITDRYVYSSIAYQSVHVNDIKLSFSDIRRINWFVPDADIIVFLDVPPTICLERIKNTRIVLEIFESIDYLTNIYNNYMKLLEQLKDKDISIITVKGIDKKGNIRTIDDVQEEIRSKIVSLIKQKGYD
mgnify:CR=1 FL=1